MGMVKKMHIIRIPIGREPEVYVKEISKGMDEDRVITEVLRKNGSSNRGRIFTVEHYHDGGVLLTEHRDGINWLNAPKRIFLNRDEAKLLAKALLDGGD